MLYQYSENQGECLIRMKKGKQCDMVAFYRKYIHEALSDFTGLVARKIKRAQLGDRIDMPIFGIHFIPPAGCKVPEKYVRVEKLSTPFHQ